MNVTLTSSDRNFRPETILQQSCTNNSQDWIWLFDHDLQILWANDKTRKSFGKDIIGKQCHAVFHSRHLPCKKLQCRACQVFVDGEEQQYESQFKTMDGQVSWSRYTSYPVKYDERGQPETVLVVVRDISDLKHVHEALNDSEDFNRTVLSAISDVFFITDDDGIITYISPNAASMGKSASEVKVGQHVEKLLSGRLPDLKGKRREPLHIEFIHEVPDESERAFQITIQRVSSSKGTTLYSCRDMTEQKKALQSAQRSKLAVDASLNAIGFADLNGNVTDVNNSFLKMWGYDRQAEIAGQPFTSLCQKAEDFLEIYKQLKKHSKWRGELIARRKDGSNFTAELSSYLLKDTHGNPACILASLVNISERKKAEETLRESDRMKSEFISTAGHELRTPLTAVMGFCELLIKNPSIGIEEQQKYLSVIYEKSLALADIVNDLLNLTRVEAGQLLCLDKKSLDIISQVENLVVEIQRHTPVHRLILELPTDPVYLSVDSGKIRQVFENLLSNAVKYSPQGGNIIIRGEIRKKDFLFSIIDNGIGMTAKQLDKIFDKFYRADSSNTAIPGLGLGMSIVKRIVEEHGGRIRLESAPARGTTVFFSLPLPSPASQT